jgi:hypothetical protein
MNKLIILILLLATIACKTDESNFKKIDPYFDTAEFVKNEIEQLSSQNFSAKKTILFNEVEETQLLENITKEMWQNEFMMLKDANFNKPALLGFYQVDTIQTNGETILQYTAINKKLQTQSLKIAENNFIETTIAKNNFMNSYEKTFIYKNQSFIGMQGWSKSLFEDTIFFYTEVTFSPQ